MKKNINTLAILVILRLASLPFGEVGGAFAQNIGINGTGANAHQSALLDLNALPSNGTGFLMPRLSTAQRIGIVSPANGLLVFDTLLVGVYRYSTVNNKWDCLNTPAGTVQHFANTTPPLGYLACNGQTVVTTTYPELFNAIGYTYGGSGSNFVVPDLRGEFIRGADMGRGVDVARVLGTAQADDFKSHTHTLPPALASYPGATFIFMFGDGTAGGNVYNTPTGATGGTETRPRNVALLSCIKY